LYNTFEQFVNLTTIRVQHREIAAALTEVGRGIWWEYQPFVAGLKWLPSVVE